MIKVISFFFERSEDGKLYREGEIIRHFSEDQEKFRVDNGYAVRLDVEKKESKPRRKKREKK